LRQRDVVHWGRASDLPRYRCKACRRTFNALTKTPLANLRMKDKWPRRPRHDDGVSTRKRLADAACITPRRFAGDTDFWLRWPRQAKTLTGIVEGDETFILESFKASGRTCAKSAREVANRPNAACLLNKYRSSLARPPGRNHGPVLPKLNRVSIAAALDGAVTPANEFCCDGGTAIVAFARGWDPAHVLQCPANQIQRSRIFTSTTSMPTIAAEGMAVSLPRRRHKNLPNYLGCAHPRGAGTERHVYRHDPRAIGMGPYQQATL